MLSSLLHSLQRYRRRRQRREPGPMVWYHEDFRIPVEGLGLETRRADLVMWALLDLGVIDIDDVAEPMRIGYGELSAVHGEELLGALANPQLLAPIFGATPDELPMANVARTIRLACGATLGAARRAAAGQGPQVNLLGGFHHASPNKGAGFSVVNDIAVAMRALRVDGVEGRIAVLDLDAHPPDGTADCINADPGGMGEVWLGSLSGSDWGVVDNVDETVLTGAGDEQYLDALNALLRRMPDCELAFVVAGGDVLEGDRFGALALTVDGAYRRDRQVVRRLQGTPSVWLAAGGYSGQAWRVLVNTVAALALQKPLTIPRGYDPLRARFSRVARELQPPSDEDAGLLSDLDLALDLGFRPEGSLRLLNTYTPEWIEHALHRYGVLDHIERLGYGDFRVEVDRAMDGDRLRVFGQARGTEHNLLELVLDRTRIGDETFLFVNWLTLRHPLAEFTEARPRLPNQEVPGLGLAQESGELLALMAKRLGLAGVVLRPAAFHVAYTARYDFSFLDPVREGRFRELIKDLEKDSLLELTQAITDGRVTLDGKRYDWEPDPMVLRLDGARTTPAPFEGEFRLLDD